MKVLRHLQFDISSLRTLVYICAAASIL